ncbi:uncharacterized protein LOC128199150 isoform X3 [Bicyclus anynana]|uniref:Uncharacterized protein LOC128198218 isoform X2 n=1 Tax=Bicyclus anynana TaxID=110368 RepID=A0ABM3LW37_BICAN|nr:uncharacterized protein LOC128198218 isoform X2 [Bicyclus anynana]XP_052743267.1 uncharacterized protein LOC128199150 isoform X3 [Bicyclus anynana]
MWFWQLQRDITTIRIQSGIGQQTGARTRPLVLASLYLPIEEHIPPKEMTDLIKYCEDENTDLIIGVDSNAHHTLWGCNENNKRGMTDSPLCRACMEEDETPLHVMLSCRGVTEQRATYIGSSATLHEAIGDLGGLLSFWSELGWME